MLALQQAEVTLFQIIWLSISYHFQKSYMIVVSIVCHYGLLSPALRERCREMRSRALSFSWFVSSLRNGSGARWQSRRIGSCQSERCDVFVPVTLDGHWHCSVCCWWVAACQMNPFSLLDHGHDWKPLHFFLFVCLTIDTNSFCHNCLTMSSKYFKTSDP